MPSKVPFKYIFSLPVNSGWNPVPTSNKEATRPLISMRPSVGWVILDNTFNKVDFPAPFLPITPIISPLLISKDMFFNAQKESFDPLFFLKTLAKVLRNEDSLRLPIEYLLDRFKIDIAVCLSVKILF